MSDTFEVKGLKELNDKLIALESETASKVLRSAGRQAMKPVLNAAINKVSVDSGDLRASLAIRASKGKGKKTAAVISVGAHKKKYSKKEGGGKIVRANAKVIALEYGNRRQKAEPFLRPALESNVGAVLESFKAQLAAKIAKATK